MLFSRFGINYNNEPEIYRKGSVVFREYELAPIKSTPTGEPQESSKEEGVEDSNTASGAAEPFSKTQQEKQRKTRAKAKIVVKHIDIIGEDFWERRPWILSGKPGRLIE